MKKVLNSEGYSSASSGGETVTNSIAGDKPTLSSQCTRVQRGRRCLPGNPNAAQQLASRAFTRSIVLIAGLTVLLAACGKSGSDEDTLRKDADQSVVVEEAGPAHADEKETAVDDNGGEDASENTDDDGAYFAAIVGHLAQTEDTPGQDLSEYPPSYYYAGGAVFDFVRIVHDEYEEVVRSSDLQKLQTLSIFYYNSYNLLLDEPEMVCSLPGLIDPEKNDTDATQWNVDVIPMDGDDMASLCFMPVDSDLYEARVFGIVLGSKGDGYYFSMINKDENAASEVYRNKGYEGVEKIGEATGRGFDLMDSFMAVVNDDYYTESKSE